MRFLVKSSSQKLPYEELNSERFPLEKVKGNDWDWTGPEFIVEISTLEELFVFQKQAKEKLLIEWEDADYPSVDAVIEVYDKYRK